MNGSTSRALVGAAAAFTVALFIFGSALLRALSADAASSVDAAPQPADTADAAPAAEPLSMNALMLAVENDPFQPDRSRPAARYRLPGDVDPPPPPAPPPPPPLPDFRLAGTAVTQEGGFAVLRVGDGPARVLAIGEYLGGYQLHRVGAETATMKNDEREITLVVPGPSARPVAAAPQRAAPRPGQQQQGNQGRQQMSREQQMQQAQMITEILQRARAEGATPQMLQAIQTMIQQRGAEALMNSEIQIRDGGMTIRSRGPDTTATRRQQP